LNQSRNEQMLHLMLDLNQSRNEQMLHNNAGRAYLLK
jgi:hypothetical protein